jgi:hypothetical protein
VIKPLMAESLQGMKSSSSIGVANSSRLQWNSIAFAQRNHQEIIFPAALVDVINKIAVERHTQSLLQM